MKLRWPLMWVKTHRRVVEALNVELAKAGNALSDARQMLRTTTASYGEQQRHHKFWEQRDALLSFMDNPRSFQAVVVMHETLLTCCDDVTKEMYRMALRKRYGPHVVDSMLEGHEPYLEEFKN